ncbi:MAG: sulfite exporter TauE/SafE family protein [Microthrixaceae bacterium]
MTPALWLLSLYATATAFGGAISGIGGATLLVPVLLLSGMDILDAAPLGLLSVAATSLAAGGRQLDAGLVHHRIGLTVELSASSFAIVGALASTTLPESWLARALGLGAFAGAMVTLSRSGVRNLPNEAFLDDAPGEWPGTLGGTYHYEGRAVPYQAQRVPLGLAVAAVAGAISGMAGVGGGFLKTPAMSEVMKVPVKVAAATSTFTTGITAASAILVFTGQGRLVVVPGAAVVLGALAGAAIGSRVQTAIPPSSARYVTGALLLVVAVVVIWRSV